MANYRIAPGWFTTTIGQRFPDLEACSAFETLGTHLAISNVNEMDELAVSASDMRAIKHAIGK